MNDNLSFKILESYVEIDKLHDNINNKMFNFINKANELVAASEDDYQIEKTTALNKISLKAYILDSECCKELENNNVVNYSIEELREYFKKYSQSYNDDYYRYFLALDLYTLLEDIESSTDGKIEMALNTLSILYPNIQDIKNLQQQEYEKFYLNIKSQIESKQLEEKAHNIAIQLLNEIFNFYISGYPTIPDEYIVKIDEEM